MTPAFFRGYNILILKKVRIVAYKNVIQSKDINNTEIKQKQTSKRLFLIVLIKILYYV